jgi:hypothetical protein
MGEVLRQVAREMESADSPEALRLTGDDPDTRNLCRVRHRLRHDLADALRDQGQIGQSLEAR